MIKNTLNSLEPQLIANYLKELSANFHKYYANENGINSRLDEMQASILNFKLKKVDNFINRRISHNKNG